MLKLKARFVFRFFIFGIFVISLGSFAKASNQNLFSSFEKENPDWQTEIVDIGKFVFTYKNESAFALLDYTYLESKPEDFKTYIDTYLKTDIKAKYSELIPDLNLTAKNIDIGYNEFSGLPGAEVQIRTLLPETSVLILEKFWLDQGLLWHLVLIEQSPDFIGQSHFLKVAEKIQESVLLINKPSRTEAFFNLILPSSIANSEGAVTNSTNSIEKTTAAEKKYSQAKYKGLVSPLCAKYGDDPDSKKPGITPENLRTGPPKIDVSVASLSQGCKNNINRFADQAKKFATDAWKTTVKVVDPPPHPACSSLRLSNQTLAKMNSTQQFQAQTKYQVCNHQKTYADWVSKAHQKVAQFGKDVADKSVKVAQASVDPQTYRKAYEASVKTTAAAFDYLKSIKDPVGMISQFIGNKVQGFQCLTAVKQSEIICTVAAEMAKLAGGVVCTAVTGGGCAGVVWAQLERSAFIQAAGLMKTMMTVRKIATKTPLSYVSPLNLNGPTKDFSLKGMKISGFRDSSSPGKSAGRAAANDNNVVISAANDNKKSATRNIASEKTKSNLPLAANDDVKFDPKKIPCVPAAASYSPSIWSWLLPRAYATDPCAKSSIKGNSGKKVSLGEPSTEPKATTQFLKNSNLSGSNVPADLKSFVENTGYLPKMADAMKRAFEAGPNNWVPTGNHVKGDTTFVRGVGDVASGRGRPSTSERQVDQLMKGESSGTEVRFVAPLSPGVDTKVVDEMLPDYAEVIGIRGKIPGSKLHQPEKFGLIGAEKTEAVLAPGTVMTDHATDIGFFMKPNPTYYNAKRYVTLYKQQEAAGMKINPNSRGYKFIQDLEKALAQIKTERSEYGNAIVNIDEVESSLANVMSKYKGN